MTTSVAGSITLALAPTGTTTFSGVIQDGAGQISVTTSGPGTQVFAGSNTYTGATTINGGVLAIAGSGATAPASPSMAAPWRSPALA